MDAVQKTYGDSIRHFHYIKNHDEYTEDNRGYATMKNSICKAFMVSGVIPYYMDEDISKAFTGSEVYGFTPLSDILKEAPEAAIRYYYGDPGHYDSSVSVSSTGSSGTSFCSSEGCTSILASVCFNS